MLLKPNPVALATELAIAAHHGQTRRDGAPYISHVLRVAGLVSHLSAEHRTVALLHDVVEDTDVTRECLRALFGPAVARAVGYLTRREGDTYEQYIARLCRHGSDLALRVKLADLDDHIACGAKGSRKERYLAARQDIEAARSLRVDGEVG